MQIVPSVVGRSVVGAVGAAEVHVSSRQGSGEGFLCSLLSHRNFSDGVQEVGDLPLTLRDSVAWNCCLLLELVTAVTALRTHPGTSRVTVQKRRTFGSKNHGQTHTCVVLITV